uniref:Enhancer of polycomb homolog 2 n=1 Tax=Equus asinus TaxID=9793 RepID=A0A9L0J6K8_EQUAS
MSKLSFRARALDAAKPLPIYRGKDMPDLNDCVSINRAVPQMPTGMEKEEESEHHLQRAISAQQVFREKKESMVIPVPEAESNVNYYNRLYKGEFKQPKQFIHIQRQKVSAKKELGVYGCEVHFPFFVDYTYKHRSVERLTYLAERKESSGERIGGVAPSCYLSSKERNSLKGN